MGNSRRSKFALNALTLLSVLGALATPAYADGSVSALHMGMGAKDASAMLSSVSTPRRGTRRRS